MDLFTPVPALLVIMMTVSLKLTVLPWLSVSGHLPKFAETYVEHLDELFQFHQEE